MRARLNAALSSVFAAALVACGGSPNTPLGSVVNSGGGGQPPPTQLVNVKLTVTIAAERLARGAMAPHYISPGTQSMAIQLASVDGNGVTGVSASVINTVPKAPGCKAQNGVLLCTATIAGSPGSDVFSVSTYDALNATGSVLSVGTVAARVASGGGGVSVSNQLSLDVNGVIAGLKLAVSPNNAKRGDAVTAGVALAAVDASGAQMVGNSAFAVPIALTIQGDATAAFSLHAAGQTGEQLSVVKPTSGITLRYDGNNQASSVTIQASVQQNDSITAKYPFTLHGRIPPPPIGTIYVLNLGTQDGQGATVTEYDNKAKGNATPLRTLDLDTKLYARSIAVDASGNLYVGYLDSSAGYSPSNGTPDAGNFVAIFAPGASGSDAPKTILNADNATQTALFPLFTAINASGGLVTFGATAVDGNAGNDAVLTYAAGASGSTPPLDGWAFTSPFIDYACPTCATGLTLDSAGNFYMAGARNSILGGTYGIFVTAAADVGNPSVNSARTLPYDGTTGLVPNETTNVSLDSAGEVIVANVLLQHNGSKTSCQGRASVYPAGATGGTTEDQPLRVLTLQGVFTNNSQCASFSNPLQFYFPSILLYGNTLFAVDDFNNAIDAYPSSDGGTVKPTLTIAGPATGLNAPIAVFVSPLSGRATAGPGNP